MDSLSRGITIILMGVLLFILPLQYINDNYEIIAHNHASEKTGEFTDSIKQQGYLSDEMYNNYVNDLNATGELYNIEIEVASSVVGSEKSSSTDNRLSTISDNEQNKSKALFLGGNEYKNTTVKKSFKNANKTNNNFLSLAAHPHIDACYNGDKHAHIGTEGLSYANGCYTTPKTTTNTYYDSYDCSRYDANTHNVTQGSISSWTCSDGKSHSTVSFSCTCGAFATVTSGSMCHASGGLSHNYNYISYCPGHKTTTTNYFIGCGKSEGSYYNGSLIAITMCENVVISIMPTNQNQSVIVGQNIVTTAMATYLDGHVASVVCSNNYNKEIGKQTVTLTYSGLIGNAKTTSTLTSTITVTTIPDIYPISIIVTLSSSEVYNGNEPTYTVTIGYDDNSSKVISSGYTKTGFTTGAGIKKVTFTYSEFERKVTTTITIFVKRNIKVCNYGHTYELDDNDVDRGCQTCNEYIVSLSVTPKSIKIPKGVELKRNITVLGTYLDGHTEEITDWTSDYNTEQSGIQLVEIVYKKLKTLITVEVIDKIICSVCGTEYDALEDGINPGCPVCREEIIGISATPNSITVPVGTDFKVKIIATFRDGHTAEIDDWSSNFDTYREGKQIVTIFYNKFTTTVTVTVIGNTTICPVCKTEYSWKENPYGCPVCSVTIESIEAYHKNESSLVTYGSNLSIYVILNYLDGHKEIAATGWTVEGYNSTRLGEQIVIVRYGIHNTNLKVTVINNLEKVTCPNGHVYYLNDDGSDPGCPYCINTDLDNGAEYITILFTEDILKELEVNNNITFNKGDYITVKIIPRELEKKKGFIKTLYNFDNKKEEIIYGGRIL